MGAFFIGVDYADNTQAGDMRRKLLIMPWMRPP